MNSRFHDRRRMRRSQVKELYDKYLWKKCSLSMYYQRLKMWIPPIEALKPIEKWIDVRSKKFHSEMVWYHKQPEPKPERSTFYQRLQKWYTKHEAIMINFEARERKPLKYNYKTYEPTYEWQKKQEQNEDHVWIRIRYKNEEAEAIRKEYENMIQELESLIVEDEEERKTIEEKLDELRNEYEDFILCNY